MVAPKNILLIVTGSVAAYKALELIRQLQLHDANVTAILTAGGSEFITPLSLSSLSGNPTYTDLFSLKDETDMGHIRLAREADAIIVAPATADIIAKIAQGRADDLASTLLLAANKKDAPVLIAPAMNHRMWEHPATQRNIETIQKDGCIVIPPDSGMMACGETGVGRMATVERITDTVLQQHTHTQTLKGKHIIVTGGATQEAIDPVRYITNHSSGTQATAIASALAQHGASVTFIHGHIDAALPPHCTSIKALSASDMLNAAEQHLPADAAICVAAVSDWHIPNPQHHKIKKVAGQDTLTLTLHKTPDILHHLSYHVMSRPKLVVGFAAETQHLIKLATEKRQRKRCDWIIGNDVSDNNVFGQPHTNAYFINDENTENWGAMSKVELAQRLTQRVCTFFTAHQHNNE